MFSSYDFMSLGLDTCKYFKWRKYELHCNTDRFRRDYGAHPETCRQIWDDLRSSTNPEIHVGKEGKPLHFLLAMRWLYKYHTEGDLGKFFGMTEKTVGKWAKHYAAKICLLLESKIPNWEDADVGLIFMLSVDGTHCPIEEPFPFSTIWSSHKLGGKPGLNYEIALRIDQPEVLSVYGPTPPGKQPDISVFRHGVLMEKMRQFAEARGLPMRGIGDKGYRGEPDFLSARSEHDPLEIAEFKNRVLARQENFNRIIKLFKCFVHAFRHGIEQHGICFRAVCAIQCYALKNESLSLLDVYT